MFTSSMIFYPFNQYFTQQENMATICFKVYRITVRHLESLRKNSHTSAILHYLKAFATRFSHAANSTYS